MEKYYNNNIEKFVYYSYEEEFIRIDNPSPGDPWSEENKEFINKYSKEWATGNSADKGVFLAMIKGEAPEDIKGLIGFDNETLYEENISPETKQELDELNPGDIVGPLLGRIMLSS